MIDLAKMPKIEMNIACDGWPSVKALEGLAESAIASVIKTAQLKFPKDAELSLLFTDNGAVKKLNSQFRDIDKPTNVLSFPGEDIRRGEDAGSMLGDIAFARETIEDEAIKDSLNFDHHLCHLMIHGFLHLFGYDHDNDIEADIMEAIETKALADMGINNPYENADNV